MDYIKQMRGFRDRRKKYPISSNAIALYLVLFEFANELRFPENFTAINAVIQGNAMLSEGGFRRAREELAGSGYIQYQKGTGRQCGEYSIIPLDESAEIAEPPKEEQCFSEPPVQAAENVIVLPTASETQDLDRQNGACFGGETADQNLDRQNGGCFGGETTAQNLDRQNGGLFWRRNESEMDTLNKHNYKYKQDDLSSSSGEPEFTGQVFDRKSSAEEKALGEIFDCWRKNIGEPPIALYRIVQNHIRDGMETALICRGIERSISADDAKCYLRKVLDNWKQEGITTLTSRPQTARTSQYAAGGKRPEKGWDGLCVPSYDLDEINRVLLEEARNPNGSQEFNQAIGG